jgi:membrane-associated phospholipid phosphatase/tRNA A-37 threonylcarbamoyl transferase component Bud32
VEPTLRQEIVTTGDPVRDEYPRLVRSRRRRRPSGEAPPLPRTINLTARFWLAATVVALGLWAVAMTSTGVDVAILRFDQAVTDLVVGLRTQLLTDVMQTLHALGSQITIRILYWSTIVVLLIVRRFRHLFVFLGSILAVTALTSLLAFVLQRPRPLGVEVLGDWTGSASPSRPVAVFSAALVGMLYTLLPQGRLRQLGKLVAAGAIAALGVARLYLAVDSLSDVLVGTVLGVTVPLLAFRLIAPNEVFPVVYRRGRTAHLDVGGRRGEAIHRALEEQLGVIVADVQPFALSGSAGSTPLRVRVKGDPDTYLFAKLYAGSHLRSDRWYKLGRTLLYGRLEDEKPYNTVRRLVQQEDYALRLMDGAGVGSPRPFGIVEITPEREYIVVTEFFENAQEIGDVEVDETLIDEGLRIIRRLWEAGLAHRDIKPANLLVREGHVHLIDVFFAEVRPSPWRQAVDLANMLLVLACRSDPQTVYRRARLQFSDEEISEAFAATHGITMPSQLRRMLREQGRDVHAEFLHLLPERPHPVSPQRWTVRRVGLMLAVLLGGLVAFALAFSNLKSAGLL